MVVLIVTVMVSLMLMTDDQTKQVLQLTMAVLTKKEDEDNGLFTDSSRQSLVEFSNQRVRRMTTLRNGNGRNPAELLRRQTIVNKSRQQGSS